MFKITLSNNKSFDCLENSTILDSARLAGIVLEHSCLSARCRSCVVKIVKGHTENIQEELVLSENEKKENYVLSCNAKPTSDLVLDIEDLGDVTFYKKKIVPSKIDAIENLAKDVIKVTLRLPPTANFNFISGQYVNLIKGDINRSYSIANESRENSKLTFYIKKYENGLMSNYWFNKAKVNDLIRVEGPLGAFFYRKSNQSEIIFLATGTGVAPIKAIIEDLESSEADYSNKNFLAIVGGRNKEDLFWTPEIKGNIKFKYIPVLSRPEDDWEGAKGYVQNILLEEKIDLSKAQVYACGSNDMIQSAREILTQNLLPENQFYSDAFVCTN